MHLCYAAEKYREGGTFYMHKKDKYLGYLYIAPWLIGFLVLTLYPFVVSLIYSFTEYDMFHIRFIG